VRNAGAEQNTSACTRAHPFRVERVHREDRVIALAGNPNVGKSTVFNALTGLKQHTGNWAGKTVSNAQGYCTFRGKGYVLVDLPGCYSILAHSAEEEIARDFLCFGGADAAVVVCDATALERNLNLVLQVLELQPRTVVCVNLMDEAHKRGIYVDADVLQAQLGVPVVTTSARSRRGLDRLMAAVAQTAESPTPVPPEISYPEAVEAAVQALLPLLEDHPANIPTRWLALRWIDGDTSIRQSIASHFLKNEEDREQAEAVLRTLDQPELADAIVTAIVGRAETIQEAAVRSGAEKSDARDRRLDRLFTGKWTGFPIMLLFLLGIFWLTMVGANYPSAWLSAGLFAAGEWLRSGLALLKLPLWAIQLLVDGAWKTLAWVVSVMLPPMAIFFPLFTLLEDLGYLPRVAFNLDRCFRKCGACGKQALTMCMGFGCNAAGVVGARIMDSPRERLIAILTNSCVPCNGRFPMLIALITVFFAAGGMTGSAVQAVYLTGFLLLGVGVTLLLSFVLSKTVLQGIPSAFTLELPPYRRPEIGKVLVRSVLDRTLFVLGRAVLSALPTGIVIWLLANIRPGGVSVLMHCAGFLEPFAVLMGLDGVILLAFLLGLPANEIVMPIALMAYLSTGSLTELTDITALGDVLRVQGWTWVTALCTVLFSLFHWPCATTLMTIRKETGSLKWTVLSALLPTVCGVLLCMAVNAAASLFGY